MLDSPTPLATVADFTGSPFGDLVRQWSPRAVSDLMIEATRACETECTRRLVPFTITETHRAQAMDPDEYSDSANIPMDIQSAVNRSYASALGVTTLVRHCWLNEYAPVFQEYWRYSGMTLEIVRSYGGSEFLSGAQFIGPEPDSGHVWFQLGQFIPIGSLIRVTYSGGYTTIPADLVRACKYMAASIATTELDPNLVTHGHTSDDLETKAVSWLSAYARG